MAALEFLAGHISPAAFGPDPLSSDSAVSKKYA
jgi:hypothetical protein